MNAMIVTASRYGSTTQGAEWIRERLELDGISTRVYHAHEAPPPENAGLIVLGSGIYSHQLLPAVNQYIDQYIDILRCKKVGLFALAMKTTPVFVRGQAHGGLSYLDYLFKKLGNAVIHAGLLGGEMVFSRLSQDDATGLERFYGMLKLSAEEIAERKKPRTLMNKVDYWAYAEVLLKSMGSRHELG